MGEGIEKFNIRRFAYRSLPMEAPSGSADNKENWKTMKQKYESSFVTLFYHSALPFQVDVKLEIPCE